jgi:hypothetical protein
MDLLLRKKPFQQASTVTLKDRPIKMPKSRLGASSAKQFSSAAPANPAVPLFNFATTTPAPVQPLFSFVGSAQAPAVINPTVSSAQFTPFDASSTSGDLRSLIRPASEEQVKIYAKSLVSLNKSFKEQIDAAILKNSAIDMTILCKEYISHRSGIQQPQKESIGVSGAKAGLQTSPDGGDKQPATIPAFVPPTLNSGMTEKVPIAPVSVGFGSFSASASLPSGMTCEAPKGFVPPSSLSGSTSFNFNAAGFSTSPKPVAPAPTWSEKTAPASIAFGSNFGSSEKPVVTPAPKIPGFGFGALATSGWTCDACLVKNKSDVNQCISCETPKPGTEKKEAPKAFAPPFIPSGALPFTFGATSSASATAPAIPSFKPAPSPVQAPKVDLSSKPPSFLSAKAESTSATSTSAFNFGASQSNSTGFSFGGSGPTQSDSTANPSFGSKLTTFGNRTSTELFKFGSEASNDTTAKVEPAKPVFGFGSATPSFGLGNLGQPTPFGGFQFIKPEPTVTSAGAVAEGEEESEPILPQADLSKGEGEENEQTIFEVKSNTSLMDADTKQWKLHGKGLLKLNKDPEGRCRLLLRNDTGKLLVNSRIFKGMSFVVKSSKMFMTQISVDGFKEPQSALIQVGKPEDSKKLMTEMEAIVQGL